MVTSRTIYRRDLKYHSAWDFDLWLIMFIVVHFFFTFSLPSITRSFKPVIVVCICVFNVIFEMSMVD